MVSIKDRVKPHFLKFLNTLFPSYFGNDKNSIIHRMAMCLSRGNINKLDQKLIESVTTSWEYSVFSQNGEDGIIEFLLSHIKDPNRYFIEIGSSDGLENNCSFLAFSKKYSGIMIEGSATKSRRARRSFAKYNWGVKYLNCFVNRENVYPLLQKESLYMSPDFFSMDIDGNDYYIMESILSRGFRPKLICVEYNSTYGPSKAITITYRPDFNYKAAHPTSFYFGASISLWRKLFDKFDYEFVTVDSNGVDAFFIDRVQFNETLPKSFTNLEFAENFEHYNRLNNTWVEQFEMIKNMNFFED